jgi:serine/threonine-protein phosphatase 2A regulatory subunit A
VSLNKLKNVRYVVVPCTTNRMSSFLPTPLNKIEHVDDDDEVLLVMADEMGKFVSMNLLGPSPDSYICLLEPLKALSSVEETVVRDKAVESACAVIKGLEAASVIEHVIPILQALTTADWFTSRVSACGLFASTYSALGAQDASGSKRLLRHLFSTLCGDDTPMVRRAASKHIGSIVSVVEKEFIVSELLPTFISLASEEPDSVRLLAIENCTVIARFVSSTEKTNSIIPLVKACAMDKSWRVRNNIAKEFFPLSEAFGIESSKGELLPLFVRLLQDPEAEVRASAAKNVAGFASLVGFDRFVADILPIVREACGLANEGNASSASASGGDLAQNVRVSLAESLVDIASSVSNQETPALAILQSSVMPLILRFLHDESADVRLKVLEGLAKVIGSVGSRYLEESVLPVLIGLGSDSLWRVREKVILQMPLLAENLGAQLFEAKLFEIYMATFADQVHSVRMSATRCLEPLSRVLGTQWVKMHIVPRLFELYRAKETSYLQRITVLYAVRNLSVIPHGTPNPKGLKEVAEELLQILLEAPNDKVPNVRFVSLQVLADAIASGAYDRKTLDKNVREVVNACLNSEKDSDVTAFAKKAAAAL